MFANDLPHATSQCTACVQGSLLSVALAILSSPVAGASALWQVSDAVSHTTTRAWHRSPQELGTDHHESLSQITTRTSFLVSSVACCRTSSACVCSLSASTCHRSSRLMVTGTCAAAAPTCRQSCCRSLPPNLACLQSTATSTGSMQHMAGAWRSLQMRGAGCASGEWSEWLPTGGCLARCFFFGNCTGSVCRCYCPESAALQIAWSGPCC